METIQSKEELQALLGEHISRDHFHNGSRLILEGPPMVEAKTLSRAFIEGGLVLLEDRGDFYNLYYFIQRQARPRLGLSLGKPAILDLVFKASPDQEELAMIQGLGFGFYLSRGQRSLALGHVAPGPRPRTWAREEDLDWIYHLQRTSIDPYTGHQISKEVLLEEILNRRVLASYQGDRLVGFLRFKAKKRSLSLENIVVHGDHRGQGYSGQLMEAFIGYGLEGAYKKIDLWVREDNPEAIGLYDKFGFGPVGYLCHNYIKKENTNGY